MADFLKKVTDIMGKRNSYRRDTKIIKSALKTLSNVKNTGPGQHTVLDQNGIHTRQVLPEDARQIGELVKFGPAGEDDWTDAWYWCKIATIDTTKAQPKEVFKTDVNSTVVKAIHPAEIGLGTDGNGVHILLNKPSHISAAEKPRFVILHYIGGLYIIETYPGAIYSDYGVGVVCKTSDGCVDLTKPGAGWQKTISMPYIGAGSPPTCSI